jgi:hypothetical protein
MLKGLHPVVFTSLHLVEVAVGSLSFLVLSCGNLLALLPLNRVGFGDSVRGSVSKPGEGGLCHEEVGSDSASQWECCDLNVTTQTLCQERFTC